MDKIILSPIDLAELFNGFRSIVKEEVEASFKTWQQEEKLLSPAESCKLFQPKISLPTIKSWTEQGLLQDYRIGSRVYYKYSEIMQAGKSLKRYKKKIA